MAYGEYLKDELAAQEVRKDSFEKRAQAVITTSGTLVTLLFALAALSTKSAATFALPHGARPWLFAALVSFFGAGIAALVTNWPIKYEATEADAIYERLKESPPWSLDKATKDVALTRVIALRSAKEKNGFKGKALTTALAFEAVAVGLVAVAVAYIL